MNLCDGLPVFDSGEHDPRANHIAEICAQLFDGQLRDLETASRLSRWMTPPFFRLAERRRPAPR
jgi:hypothetical protein